MQRLAILLLLLCSGSVFATSVKAQTQWEPATLISGLDGAEGHTAKTARYKFKITLELSKETAILKVHRGNRTRVQTFSLSSEPEEPQWFVTAVTNPANCPSIGYKRPGEVKPPFKRKPTKVTCTVTTPIRVAKDYEAETMKDVQPLLKSVPEQYKRFFK